MTWSEFQEHWGGTEYEVVPDSPEASTAVLVSPAGSRFRLDAEMWLVEPVSIAWADLA